MATSADKGRPEVGGFDEPMQVEVESERSVATLINVRRICAPNYIMLPFYM
jgi:hypothetical protein